MKTHRLKWLRKNYKRCSARLSFQAGTATEAPDARLKRKAGATDTGFAAAYSVPRFPNRSRLAHLAPAHQTNPHRLKSVLLTRDINKKWW